MNDTNNRCILSLALLLLSPGKRSEDNPESEDPVEEDEYVDIEKLCPPIICRQLYQVLPARLTDHPGTCLMSTPHRYKNATTTIRTDGSASGVVSGSWTYDTTTQTLRVGNIKFNVERRCNLPPPNSTIVFSGLL